ncbi:PilW family protein [Desulfoluna sp.]|uniref:PilW family protein n=1 Tax=Desulfoluna sp. TaxID=2045199 RepID=UPI0026105B9C|nr:prepilin-type N-terminal cleavage/methylation domain-containing protein [Desulfoluna sp.]
MRRTIRRPIKNDQGITLVELLVALALGTIVSVALIATFAAYSRTQVVQENVLSMQQNLRAALYLMGRDLRMAGYRGPDPTNTAATGFLTATPDALSFTFFDDDSGTLSTLAYAFLDSDGDGTKDVLRRNDGTTNEIVAEQIDRVEFYYTLGSGGPSTAPGTLTDIEAVRITVLARTHRRDRDFSTTTTYTTPSGVTWGPFNDGMRRRLGERFILFRNL